MMKNSFAPIFVLFSLLVQASNTEYFGGNNLQPTVSSYPNPASDRFYLTISSTYSNTGTTIKMYDVLGKLVFSKEGNDTDGTGKSSNIIDVNEYFPGIYTVVVTDAEGNSSTPHRIMISH